MIGCPACDQALPAALLADGRGACPDCRGQLVVDVFPAALRPPTTGRPGDVLTTDGEASCFFHTDRRAVIACDRCGRFLCALCDLPMGSEHLCPRCLDAGADSEPGLVNRRTLWDSIALSMAILPLLVCYAVVITAPATLVFVHRYRRRPGSLVRRSRIRFALASIVALLEIGAIGIFVALMFLGG